MKKLSKILLMIVAMVTIIISSSFAQVEQKNNLSIKAISNGLVLTGANSNDTKVGPYFGGSVAYGLGYGVTVFAESGYGWTNFNSVDGLKFVQIPIIGGVTYNFGSLINSDIIQPYAGVSAGAYLLRLRQDGNTIFKTGFEQRTTSFGLQGIVGVNFQVDPAFAIDIRGNFSHLFSKTGDPGVDSQEFNSVGFGGGISYSFSL